MKIKPIFITILQTLEKNIKLLINKESVYENAKKRAILITSESKF